MKKVIRAFKIAAVNMVILVVLVEAASIGTYFFQTGTFFYGHSTHRKIASTSLPLVAANQGSVQQVPAQLHPYFGFATQPGIEFQSTYSQATHVSNNSGFWSKYPYPFKRQHSNQFIVGVFGGSVAAQYSFFAAERNTLAAELKKLPALANKEIIILPYALGAYKQPQQLIVLSYFLSIGQDFDLVINIDGFNEVALSYINYRNGLDSSMPCSYVIVPLVNLATCNGSEEELQLTLDVIRNRKRFEDSIKSMETSRFATGYVMAWLRARFAERRYRQDVVNLDRLRTSATKSGQSYMLFPTRPNPGEDQVFAETVFNWSSSSLLMKELLDRRNTPYFQFIQPNQYEPTDRTFTENERAIAISGASDFRTGVLKGYPLLLAELVKLQQAGVNAQSAINVFDNVSEPVYEDNCCHYNERGNEIFGAYVANTIRQALSKNSRYQLPATLDK